VVWTGLVGSREIKLESYCEHGNDLSGSHKMLADHQVAAQLQASRVVLSSKELVMHEHAVHFQTKQHCLLPDVGFCGGCCHAVLNFVTKLCQYCLLMIQWLELKGFSIQYI
jgi:hypothetical protein